MSEYIFIDEYKKNQWVVYLPTPLVCEETHHKENHPFRTAMKGAGCREVIKVVLEIDQLHVSEPPKTMNDREKLSISS